MQELIKIEERNGLNVVSTRIVAKELGKEHRRIMQDIKEKGMHRFVQWIIPSKYKAENNQYYDEYLLTKDGFTMLVFNYQGFLDFKEAYINKFNEMEKSLKFPEMSEMEMISKIASSQHETLKRVETVENSVQKLENTMTIDTAKQRHVQKAVAIRVFGRVDSIYVESCGTWEKSKIKQKVFANIYRNLKDKFAVSSYKDIRVVDYDKAIQFIENWIEDSDLLGDE